MFVYDIYLHVFMYEYTFIYSFVYIYIYNKTLVQARLLNFLKNPVFIFIQDFFYPCRYM